MKPFQVVVAHIAISIIVFISNAYAAVSIQKPSFSLSLPEGWVEIPQDVLSAMQAELKQQVPNATIPKYDYGFQREPSRNWMEYPYVLVQVINTGRVPEHQLRSMPKIDLNERLKDRTSKLQPIMSNVTLGKMQYDEAAHVVWITTRSDVENIGKILGITGLIPTEKGVIQLHAYSLESDFQGHLPTFRQMITSTIISPDIVYRPRWSDSSPILSGIDWGQVTIAGIIGGFIALVGGLIRKRKAG